MCSNKSIRKVSSGSSLAEVLVTTALIGILLAIGVANFKRHISTPKSSISELIAALRKIQYKAIATTSTYTIRPSGPSRIVATVSKTCSGVSEGTDNSVSYELNELQFESTEWSICYRSNGRTEVNLVVQLLDHGSVRRSIEFLLGGNVREVI
jgi:Tfp pilus assembly protein FimT